MAKPFATRVACLLFGLFCLPAFTFAQGTETATEAPAEETTGEENADQEAAPREFGTEVETDRIVDSLQEPLNAEVVNKSLKRGVDYLLESQHEGGYWGAPTRTKALNIYAPVPGAHHAFRMGTSALALCALIELEEEHPEVTPAIDRAEKWMLEALPKLRRADQTAIYNVWGHAYSLQALARMHDRHEGDEKMLETIGELVEQQFDMLTRYESVDGGWGYYDMRYGTDKPSSDSISFVNATVLVAFNEVRERGYKPPQKIVDRAIAATERQQKKDFSYLYGEYLKYSPVHPVNRPGGSLGRSQACNIALRYWGQKEITNAVLAEWLERLVVRNGWLDLGRKKPVPHESWFAVAGYFYFYGHYYGALCLEQLPVEDQARFSGPLARLMLDRQEKDGSWWDYPLYSYHQPYGTAFALMTLKRCRDSESTAVTK